MRTAGKYASGFKTFPKSERQYNELAWVHAWGGKNSTNRTTEYDNQTPGFWVSQLSALGPQFIWLFVFVLASGLPACIIETQQHRPLNPHTLFYTDLAVVHDGVIGTSDGLPHLVGTVHAHTCTHSTVLVPPPCTAFAA